MQSLLLMWVLIGVAVVVLIAAVVLTVVLMRRRNAQVETYRVDELDSGAYRADGSDGQRKRRPVVTDDPRTDPSKGVNRYF